MFTLLVKGRASFQMWFSFPLILKEREKGITPYFKSLVIIKVWNNSIYRIELWEKAGIREEMGLFVYIVSEAILGNIRRNILLFSSVQFSRLVMSDSLWPHESQHARTPHPSPSPWVHSNSCPSSRRCHPAISSSVVPFFSWPQSLPASESFPMSQLFTGGGQSTGVSALASFLPKNTQGWSPLEWTGWTSLQSKGLSRVFYY